jgi:hypothetical protein
VKVLPLAPPWQIQDLSYSPPIFTQLKNMVLGPTSTMAQKNGQGYFSKSQLVTFMKIDDFPIGI